MDSVSEKRNYFRVKLSQEGVSLYERVLDADQFNPFTRYSVDIRDILRDIIGNLQKLMSNDNLTTKTKHTNENYDLVELAGKVVNRYNPKTRTKYIEDVDITLRGVKCKFGLYINDNPIVERDFYVDGFNPKCRWSTDLIDEMNVISEIINNRIRESDIENTWNDHDMIHVLGYDFLQIMEFTPDMRRDALRRLEYRRNNY